MKDLSKLYVYVPATPQQTEKWVRTKTREVLELLRNRTWRNLAVIVRNDPGHADVAFCPTQDALDQVKRIQPELHCFVPDFVSLGPNPGKSGATRLRDDGLMIIHFSDALRLVMVGIQSRIEAMAVL